MNAKQRYKRRLRLQAAISRTIHVLVRHLEDEIPPDPTTALLASQLVKALGGFCQDAGVDPMRAPDQPGVDRFGYTQETRQKETFQRQRRRMIERMVRFRRHNPQATLDMFLSSVHNPARFPAQKWEAFWARAEQRLRRQEERQSQRQSKCD